MFNFFKQPLRVNKNYPAIVQEIHNEFFSAGDSILEEAKSIIKECESVSLDKGKRLSAIGFGNSKEAKIAEETSHKLLVNKEIADLSEYYLANYPFNKFITDIQVKSICEKYGLVLGEVSMYRGFVPENKLSQIENFKLRKEDIPLMTVYDERENIIGYVNKEDWENVPKFDDYFYITGSGGRRLGYSFDVPIYEKYKHLSYVKAYKKTPSLQICAPLKDMELDSNKVLNGHKIESIPDPIVLQPIRGGYLIIAAWGDEQYDEDVFNNVVN